jgi:hypothetical protein
MARGLSLCLATAALAGVDEARLPGRWVAEGEPAASVEFYGAGLGRLGGPSALLHFSYRIEADGAQLALRLSDGSRQTHAADLSDGTLRLVSTGGSVRVYAKAPSSWTTCQLHLRRLAAASALYAADHEGRFPASLADLYPGYLSVLPACPSEGTYALGDGSRLPACSVEGHTPGD